MKVAFIGTHGVGKTTLAFGMASRLKRLGANVGFLEEVARRCPFPINEDTSLEAQTWILVETIRREIELCKIYPKVPGPEYQLGDNSTVVELGEREVLQVIQSFKTPYDNLAGAAFRLWAQGVPWIYTDENYDTPQQIELPDGVDLSYTQHGQADEDSSDRHQYARPVPIN